MRYAWFRVLFLGCLLMLPAALAFCANGKIRGTVRDDATRQALPGANIVLVGTTLGAMADAGGNYTILNVPPGVYRLLGRTRDDAAGEAYDKVAKLLGLGYPGGPIIDRLAREGNDAAVDFPVSRMTHRDRHPKEAVLRPAGVGRAFDGRLEFSFSGIKTAVARYVKTQYGGADVPEAAVSDICASFQRAVVGALLDRTFEAVVWFGARSIGIAGGVSANSRLRSNAVARGEREGLPVFVPALALSTDNAAMIAASGLRQLRAGVIAPLDLNADASLRLPVPAGEEL